MACVMDSTDDCRIVDVESNLGSLASTVALDPSFSTTNSMHSSTHVIAETPCPSLRQSLSSIENAAARAASSGDLCERQRLQQAALCQHRDASAQLTEAHSCSADAMRERLWQDVLAKRKQEVADRARDADATRTRLQRAVQLHRGVCKHRPRAARRRSCAGCPRGGRPSQASPGWKRAAINQVPNTMHPCHC